jgi:glycosyltransferase involved in cell wall biosynthesis
MGAGCETGQVAMWCARKQKRFVFATASDADCNSALPLLKSHKEKYLYRYGLDRARVVISQTHEQQRLLSTHYAISSEMFRIMSPQPQSESTALERHRRILWVGRICPEKRPHLLLDISQRLPEYTFDLIGETNADTEYARDFHQKATKNPSIIVHGRVSNELLNKMYDEAYLLVGTSKTEGFPVTFIEAWSRGIPVVSTFDPDGVIQAHGLGYVAQDVEGTVSRLREIIGSPEIWLRASEAARQYYLANHAPEVCLPAFERLLSRL